MYKPPVAFFGFNRPDCTKVVFEEIRRYQPAKLLLVADGPRPEVATDKSRCEAVREIMKSVDWDCEIKTNFSEANLGCKKRMSSGIDWVFAEVEEAILLEDDCVPSPDFFRFCAELLVRYRDDPNIISVAGTNYQNGQIRGNDSYYFSRYPNIWGWASWRRAWQQYDVTMHSWPELREQKLISKMGLAKGECKFWTHFFDETYAGKIDSWDGQWVYACWRNNGIAAIPNVNLITNIGAGPDATHTKGPINSLAMPTGKLDQELRHPMNISIDQEADKYVSETQYGGKETAHEKAPLKGAHAKLSRLKGTLKALFTSNRA
jgi:hypothetical protein